MCTFSWDDAVSDSAPDLLYTETSSEKHARAKQTKDILQHCAQPSCAMASTQSEYAETVSPHPVLVWTPWILLSVLYQRIGTWQDSEKSKHS